MCISTPPGIRGPQLSASRTQGTAAYTTSMVQLTAVATPVIAVLNGPQGDVLSTNPIAFSSASIDPDAAATPSSALVQSRPYARLLGAAKRAHCS
jgi:hypothetical protein